MKLLEYLKSKKQPKTIPLTPIQFKTRHIREGEHESHEGLVITVTTLDDKAKVYDLVFEPHEIPLLLEKFQALAPRFEKEGIPEFIEEVISTTEE